MRIFAISILFLSSSLSQAQEATDFLACAEISDRVARVICLEEALERATQQEQVDVNAEAAAVENFGNNTNASSAIQEDADVEADTNRQPFFRLPRIRNPFSRNNDEVETETAEIVETQAESEQGGEVEELADFGLQSRVLLNEEGESELFDVVVELDMVRPDQWLLTMASGQVWRQTHPRRLNLKKGDNVRIYPSGWGRNFRLETERLSGFIQVLRLE